MPTWLHFPSIFLPFSYPWGLLGGSWGVLEASWADLGPSWAHLGASWHVLARLGASWKRLGTVLALKKTWLGNGTGSALI